MKIVFMGTPDFAVPCLKALIQQQEQIIGVYTQPDKPKGRGHQLQPPPVKVVAMEHDIPVFQPNTLRTQEVYEQLKQLQPDVIIVVAYGKMLPLSILQLPQYGCINVHASLLPKYRGAGPIQWSVLNGEKVTGVTTMYMAEGMDTGDMILKMETQIGENETASELHDRLSVIGAKALIETIEHLKDGTIVRTVQDDIQATYAPMLSKELSKIDFTKSAQEVHNQIRGLSSWPCAVTTLLGKRLKVYRSELVKDGQGAPGEVLSNRQLIVACGDGHAVHLAEVQFENAKRMKSEDFLRGRPLAIGTICGQI